MHDFLIQIQRLQAELERKKRAKQQRKHEQQSSSRSRPPPAARHSRYYDDDDAEDPGDSLDGVDPDDSVSNADFAPPPPPSEALRRTPSSVATSSSSRSGSSSTGPSRLSREREMLDDAITDLEMRVESSPMATPQETVAALKRLRSKLDAVPKEEGKLRKHAEQASKILRTCKELLKETLHSYQSRTSHLEGWVICLSRSGTSNVH